MRACTRLLAIALVLAVAPAARAQGSEGTGLGLGIQSTLTGVTGPTLAYQTPQFHVEGLLGFHDDGYTEIDFAGRFFWEVHSTAASDLSLGGGLALVNIDPGPGDSTTDIHLEIGAQIRAFLAANVALSGTLGLGFVSGDADVVFLGGQLMGSLGATYYFF